jgi:hypothetical protein
LLGGLDAQSASLNYSMSSESSQLTSFNIAGKSVIIILLPYT